MSPFNWINSEFPRSLTCVWFQAFFTA